MMKTKTFACAFALALAFVGSAGAAGEPGLVLNSQVNSVSRTVGATDFSVPVTVSAYGNQFSNPLNASVSAGPAGLEVLNSQDNSGAIRAYARPSSVAVTANLAGPISATAYGNFASNGIDVPAGTPLNAMNISNAMTNSGSAFSRVSNVALNGVGTEVGSVTASSYGNYASNVVRSFAAGQSTPLSFNNVLTNSGPVGARISNVTFNGVGSGSVSASAYGNRAITSISGISGGSAISTVMRNTELVTARVSNVAVTSNSGISGASTTAFACGNCVTSGISR